MNYCFVFIFAFQVGLSFENISKTDKLKWKNVTKFSCKRINCPPVEEPTCVRMRNKKIGSKTKDIYIMLLNRCEMEYMKCHQDYQATEVSMKNCGHYDKSGRSGKLRVKRETLRGIKKQGNQTYGSPKTKLDKQGNVTLKQFKPYRPKSILGDISVFGFPFGTDVQQHRGGAVRSTPKPSSKEANSKNNEESDVKTEDDSESSTEASEKEDKDNTVDVKEEAEFITIEKHSQESETEDTTRSPLLDGSAKEEENNIEASIKENEEDENNNDVFDSNKEFSDNVTENDIVQLESNEEESQSSKMDSEKDPKINVETEEDSREDPKIGVKTDEDSKEEPEMSAKTDEDSKEDPTISVKSEESGESHSIHVPEDTSEEEDGIPKRFVTSKTTSTPKPSAQYSNDDYDLMAANEGVDFEEYGKECPTVCPAAEVMLCGRCKDGVYRTFMSVCHLRMFNCKHPGEKVELVTRYPCVLSAPYLQEAPSPRGRVSQPGDRDVVLQYIRCREKKNLGENDKDDPGCYFEAKS